VRDAHRNAGGLRCRFGGELVKVYLRWRWDRFQCCCENGIDVPAMERPLARSREAWSIFSLRLDLFQSHVDLETLGSILLIVGRLEMHMCLPFWMLCVDGLVRTARKTDNSAIPNQVLFPSSDLGSSSGEVEGSCAVQKSHLLD
jgi:hypothetical protein